MREFLGRRWPYLVLVLFWCSVAVLVATGMLTWGSP